MKKTLIALAAVAATSVAFAQSSVTLYGVADVSLAKSSGTSLRFDSAGSHAVGSNGFNNGGSRWGIRGVEDLGGGLKAGFNFEQGLSLRDGGADTPAFQRAAYMTLSGGFGEVSLGRRLGPSFNAYATWELTGAANYSAVGNQFGATVLGGAREDSMIMYTSPNFGGVTVQFAHVLKANNGGTDAVNDLNVRYVSGPLRVGFDYKKEGSVTNKHLGARYDFGGFQIAGAWLDPNGASKGFSIGGSTTVGPVGLTVDYARDTNNKQAIALVEGKYALSKRTFAYAAYQNRNQSRPNTFGLGVRHNF